MAYALVTLPKWLKPLLNPNITLSKPKCTLFGSKRNQTKEKGNKRKRHTRANRNFSNPGLCHDLPCVDDLKTLTNPT
jgi:hypothetical protein